MINAALVLEGGSMRGLFTAAVLDLFLEKDLTFAYVNGVSAGSMNGMNYVSRQAGRTLKVTTEYARDKRYMSFENLVKKRQVFNFDFLFGELSTDLVPFDFETFEQSPQKFEVVATRCRTGKPEYFEKSECSDMMTAVRASSSLPLLSGMITLDKKKYLDGGASMPVAYQRALDLGYEKVVLVLTRHHGYQKQPASAWMQRAYEQYFKPLPEFLEALETIPSRYNQMQEEITRLEQEGKLFVIRPEFPVTVSRMERDTGKLTALYEEGRRIGEERLELLYRYLEEDK